MMTSGNPAAPLSSVAPAIAVRVGREAMQQVYVVENHDAAYYIWREARVSQRVLLHVDAHHDMWRPKEPGNINIANFIGSALQDGIASEILWVVPDDTWRNSETRRHVLRHLQEIVARYPD